MFSDTDYNCTTCNTLKFSLWPVEWCGSLLTNQNRKPSKTQQRHLKSAWPPSFYMRAETSIIKRIAFTKAISQYYLLAEDFKAKLKCINLNVNLKMPSRVPYRCYCTINVYHDIMKYISLFPYVTCVSYKKPSGTKRAKSAREKAKKCARNAVKRVLSTVQMVHHHREESDTEPLIDLDSSANYPNSEDN